MKKISTILSFVIAFSMGMYAQTFEHVDYVISDDNIANPERGFYHQVNRFSTDDLSEFKKQGIKLILKNYVLKDFRNKPISADFLRDIQRDFDMVRKAGFKMIVRFAYTTTITHPYGDAPPEIVLMHIKQLSKILKKNSDVILTMQAGFIGTWGEWYYTDYFSESPGVITEKNWNDRRAVVDNLLDVLPKDRMIQLRTPTYIRQMQQEDEFIAISKENAYNGSKKARLAFHNDCFVAGPDDWGTYEDIEKEKKFLEQHTKYTIAGGETCSKSLYSNCSNSLKELKRFHYTFINIDYHPGVLSQWRTEGCFDEIQNKLGYRYVLQTAKLQNEAKPGGKIDFSIELINEGWANPTNEYTVQLVLRDTVNNNTYRYNIQKDIRKLELNEKIVLDIKAGLPNDMEQGNYAMFIGIKDKRAALFFDKEYKIRFANRDVWNEKYGENSMDHTIVVDDDYAFPEYQGTNFFVKDDIISPDIDSPGALTITQYNKNNILSWPDKCDDKNEVIRIFRSVDSINFNIIAVKNSDDISYVDKNLEDNTDYYYKAQFVSGDRYSNFVSSQIHKTNPDTRHFLKIKIDGEQDDWNCVLPLVSYYTGSMNMLKLTNDKDFLYFSIADNDLNDYELTFNTNDSILYKLTNDSLFENTGNESVFLHKIITEKNTGFIEGQIKLADIKFVTFPNINVRLSVNGATVCDNKQYYYLKNKKIRVPDRFKIKPSVVTPYSKVKISWKLDSNVEGYIIERSIGDSTHFEPIIELSRRESYYLDKNLDSSKVYYYRMFAFSDVIRSPYTKTIKIHLGTSATGDLPSKAGFALYPNPMRDKSILKINANSTKRYDIGLYDTNMRLIRKIHEGLLQGKAEFEIDRGKLQSSIYFLIISRDNLKKAIKLIVL